MPCAPSCSEQSPFPLNQKSGSVTIRQSSPPPRTALLNRAGGAWRPGFLFLLCSSSTPMNSHEDSALPDICKLCGGLCPGGDVACGLVALPWMEAAAVWCPQALAGEVRTDSSSEGLRSEMAAGAGAPPRAKSCTSGCSAGVPGPGRLPAGSREEDRERALCSATHAAQHPHIVLREKCVVMWTRCVP